MARREISSIKLAELLGVSDMWVSRRMRGKTQITMEDLERLADVLGVPVSTFLPAERAATPLPQRRSEYDDEGTEWGRERPERVA